MNAIEAELNRMENLGEIHGDRLIQALRRRGEQVSCMFMFLQSHGIEFLPTEPQCDNEILAILKGEK